MDGSPARRRPVSSRHRSLAVTPSTTSGVWQRPDGRYLRGEMKRLFGVTVVLVAALVVAAKIILRSRVEEDLDEADLAVVMTSAAYRPTANPYLGATVLVVAGVAEIDLTQVEPAPTGIELALSMCAARLRVTVPSTWNVSVELEQRTSDVRHPSERTSDAPWLRIIGRAWFSAVEVVQA